MEINIKEISNVHSEGNIEIILPKYMNALSNKDIKNVLKLKNKSNRIIAIGLSSTTNEIIFLTGDKKFMIYDHKNHFSNHAIFHPIENGKIIYVQSNNSNYEIYSKNLIENSQNFNVFLSSNEDINRKVKKNNKRSSREKS